MGTLLFGLGLFFATHAVPMKPDVRARIVKKIGLVMYQGLFALISIVALILIVRGYAQADMVPVWIPPVWAHHVTYLIMLPVFPLLVAAYLPGQAQRFIAHPLLLAIKLWALAHLVSNGDLASFLLFGGVLAYAVVDLVSLKRRERAKGVVAKVGPIRNDAIAVIIGLAVHAGMLFWGHEALIGVTLLG